LEDEAWIVRYQAVQILTSRQDPRVDAAFLDHLAQDRTLALACARALATRGRLEALLEHLKDAPPWRFLAIAAALGQIDDDDARRALVSLVGHPDDEVDQAILAHGAKVVPPLCLVLADEDWGRRWHAVRLLGRLGDRSAAVPLLPLAEDPRPEVKLAAIEALAQLGDAVALSDLVACLQDASWRVRASAAEALGRLGVAEAWPALEAALADPRLEVRDAARGALDRRQASG
jgi:HEAT repeat protein